MLLDMMSDEICDFLIGVFFFLVTLRCRAVAGQVLMTAKFSAFNFDFMYPVVIVCGRVFVMLMMLQRLSFVWRTIWENNVFSCGGVMDKDLGFRFTFQCKALIKVKSLLPLKRW